MLIVNRLYCKKYWRDKSIYDRDIITIVQSSLYIEIRIIKILRLPHIISYTLG